VNDVVNSFLVILAQVTWPLDQLPDGSISFKFLLETRLKCEPFELLTF